MKSLKPIYDFDRYSVGIAKAIYAQLYEEIFAPLYNIFISEKQNAKDTPLIKALLSRKVEYSDGYFYGSFNAAISKELRAMGARFNKLRKAYKLELGQVPTNVLLAISQGSQIAKDQLRKVQDFLRAVEGRKLSTLKLKPLFDKTFENLDRQFHTTTKKVSGKDLEIPIREELKEKLAEAYTENLDLYIQKWHDEQVLRLRSVVAKNVEKGYRSENLIQSIQQEQGVSYNKAKFLARQETSLMVSKYRQIRYEEIGVRKYQWSTSHDERVRPDHKALQGRIFRFDEPPITDRATGARNNPGEDFNCRCVAIPVLSTVNMLEPEYAGRKEA